MPEMNWIEYEDECPECGGQGRMSLDCHRCSGTGLPQTGPIDGGRCGTCGGRGYVECDCFECESTGKIYKETQVPSFV